MYLNRGCPASVEQALDDSEEAERRITVATEQIRNDLSRAPRSERCSHSSKLLRSPVWNSLAVRWMVGLFTPSISWHIESLRKRDGYRWFCVFE